MKHLNKQKTAILQFPGKELVIFKHLFSFVYKEVVFVALLKINLRQVRHHHSQTTVDMWQCEFIRQNRTKIFFLFSPIKYIQIKEGYFSGENFFLWHFCKICQA